MLKWFQKFIRKKSISLKIIDTSSLIDGRILDLIETGFLEGKLIVPQFILEELQQVADSNDDIKRKRGRRGLYILEKLKKLNVIEIVNKYDKETNEVETVDIKLVKLCNFLDAKLITVDFNLNKVAKINSVSVLSVNDLNNALKPHISMDEIFWIRIIKKGNQKNQGVGYLDDGTMVIVDQLQAEEHINEKVKVIVKGINQTPSARIIFTKTYKEREL